MTLKKGDYVLIIDGVFTGFIGIIKKVKKDGAFIITHEFDYNLQIIKKPLTIQIYRDQLKKTTVINAKELRLVKN